MNGDVWLEVAKGIPMTLQLAGLGFAIGAIAGVPLMLMRNSRLLPLRWVARAVIEILRGVPPLVWLFLIFAGLPELNPALLSVLTPTTSAIIGLGLISSAYMAEIYRGCLSAISRGQWEASSSLGMSKYATATHVIGPQMLRISIPAAATYAIGLLKDSSIAYTIGALEITWHAWSQQQQLISVTPYIAAAVYFVAITFPAAWLARTVDARLRRRVAQ
jgi:polar amino acid transport system permease protein